MPYIDPKYRAAARLAPTTPGELNYAITMLIKGYVCGEHPASYTTFNEVVGAIESAKLEFYRRIVVPFEQGKMVENGDVY